MKKVQEYFKYEIEQRARWLKEMRAARDDKTLNEIIDALVALDDDSSMTLYAGSAYVRGYVKSYDEHVERVRKVIGIGQQFNLSHKLTDEFEKDGSANIYFGGFRLGDQSSFNIHYMVNLSIFGASCRLVQVGVKTVEQPVYELVCDDGQEASDAYIQN